MFGGLRKKAYFCKQKFVNLDNFALNVYMCKLERKDIARFSSQGWMPRGVRVVKRCHCRWVKDYTLTGDAPKEFVRVYHYEKGQSWTRKNACGWPEYIAKTGHKWYPNESITEYLMNRLGEVFGLTMADSDLAMINGQLRFLSRYFLRRGKDQLIHGAEIFAGYLEDERLVEAIEEEGRARDLFTMQFVEKAVGCIFAEERVLVMHELVRLVLFDALVGNNDRHYYNWGVVIAVDGSRDLRFAPVYDTARGLFWNDDDDKVRRRLSQGEANVNQYIAKYCRGSKPKLGWEGDDSINHFRMVEHLVRYEFYVSREEATRMFADDVLVRMCDVVDTEFKDLMIPERRLLVKRCLEYRFKEIKKIIEL